MSYLKSFQAGAVAFACLGLLLPGNFLYAQQQGFLHKGSATPVVRDVALALGGRLQGVVVDAQGRPLSGERVVLRQSGRLVANTLTDKSGRFFVGNLQGGVYRVDAARQANVYRLWAMGTAPPAARPQVFIVANERVHRGQRPLGDLFVSKPFLLSMIIAAAIAIPIAVQNSGTDNPSGS